MSIQEQRRKCFEEWARSEGYEVWHQAEDGTYLGGATAIAWVAWNAALDSGVIELPGYAMDYGFNDAIDECREAIESAGLKVKS